MALFGLFGKKTRTLNDLTLDDLNRERITLQNEQRKLDVEAERFDRDEGQLKGEYAVAATPTQKKSIARRVQDLRARRQANETKSAYCHKMLQTVNSFLLIKENMEFYRQRGVTSILSQMDMAEIEAFINEATIEGTLQQEKLAAMLQQASDGAAQLTQGTGDASLDDLMAELDGEAAGSAQAAHADPALDAVMRNLDTAIARGEQAARQAQGGAGAQRSPQPGAPTPAPSNPTPQEG